MSRPQWPFYFLKLARAAAARGTCNRARVGAVIVRDRMVLTTGFNGAPRGLPHCDDVGHDMVDGHCQRAQHAESNALAQAAREGVSVAGAGIYITHYPCWACFRLLINAGICRVNYDSAYRPDPRVIEAAKSLGIVISDPTALRNAARFWKRVSKTPGCWLWTGAKFNAGYGALRWAGRAEYAHRVAWELERGPVPGGLHVLHRCDNRSCVREDHLFLSTNTDNINDRIKKRWVPVGVAL